MRCATSHTKSGNYTSKI